MSRRTRFTQHQLELIRADTRSGVEVARDWNITRAYVSLIKRSLMPTKASAEPAPRVLPKRHYQASWS